MKRLFLTLVAAALFVQASNAGTITYLATLLGTSENPANASPGIGAATVIIDTVAQTMEVDVTFSGLLGTTTASHIHCCETAPNLNNNVGVATTTPYFTGFPIGVTSGTYDHTFDLTMASSYNPSFVTAQGSLANAEAALLAGLANQETYLNIHTTVDPGGEIRGILSQATPEPATLFLAGTALLGLSVLRRRTKRSDAGQN
jgi:hypothetical protein